MSDSFRMTESQLVALADAGDVPQFCLASWIRLRRCVDPVAEARKSVRSRSRGLVVQRIEACSLAVALIAIVAGAVFALPLFSYCGISIVGLALLSAILALTKLPDRLGISFDPEKESEFGSHLWRLEHWSGVSLHVLAQMDSRKLREFGWKILVFQAQQVQASEQLKDARRADSTQAAKAELEWRNDNLRALGLVNGSLDKVYKSAGYPFALLHELCACGGKPGCSEHVVCSFADTPCKRPIANGARGVFLLMHEQRHRDVAARRGGEVHARTTTNENGEVGLALTCAACGCAVPVAQRQHTICPDLF